MSAHEEARDRAQRARDNAEWLRLATDHLRTAAALIDSTVRAMFDYEEQTGFALTIACTRDRVAAARREVARWAEEERNRSAREAEKALPFELRP